MRTSILFVLALGLVVLVPGCLQDATPEPGTLEEDVVPANTQVTSPLDLKGEACTQGGGHSVHPQEVAGAWDLSATVPEPWRVADVLGDTGDQLVYSEVPDPTTPIPEEGNTWGHYHATLMCKAWTLDGEPLSEDVLFGFVGPKVQTPAFAEPTGDNEYLSTVIATNHEAIYERLQEGGVDAMWATGGIQHDPPGPVRVDMRTDHNGEYLSIYELNELGSFNQDTIRLWSQSENDNGTFTPIAVDMHVQGGTHYGAQQQAYFHHMATAHHWPLPGAGGNTAAVHYEGFNVQFAWGPTPNVALDAHYDH